MGDFIQSIGNGIAGLVGGAFDVIGSTLRGIVDAADAALPGGLLALVIFVALVITAWRLSSR